MFHENRLGVSELWGVENRPLPLTRPMAYTTDCTTVQAVIVPQAETAAAAALLCHRQSWHTAYRPKAKPVATEL